MYMYLINMLYIWIYSGDDRPKTADVEAAALADLVLQQHTQLKRVPLNLVAKVSELVTSHM